MADHSADPRRVDCHALRRDEEAGGHGRGDAHGPAGLGALTLVTARAVPLRLIEPDGSQTEVLPATTSRTSAGRAAQERAERQAKEDAARLAAEEAEREAEAARKAEEEAARKAKEEAKRKAKEEAERKAKEEAARRAKEEAERKAKEEAKRKAAEEAERKVKEEAERKAKEEAERKAKEEAKRRAKEEAERKAREEAERKAKEEAERKAKEEAERKAREEAEQKAKEEAALKAKQEAERQAREEAERKAKEEAERKAKEEAARKAKEEAEREAKKEAERKAKEEAERKAKEEAERKTREEAAARKKAEADARKKAKAEAKAREKAEAERQAEAAEKAKNLGQTFRRLIKETGPISLAHYMAESNARYYTSRDPLGEEGDFITAPEVSQMFGELVGLWFADLWVRMGARKHIHFVELGPGRGTLSKDALRTAARYDFDPQVHFVEVSPALRKLQREAFPDVHHHDDISTLPEDAPLLIVANEFFDALPIHQLVRAADGWHERMVGLAEAPDGSVREDADFAFVAGSEPMDAIVPKSWRSASQGTMIETSPAATALMGAIAERLKEQGGAALIFDYGALELRAGSTLQALRAHEKVDPFAHPGQADLTAHVDFELLKSVAEANGADVMGLTMQGDWLRAMGIDVRLEALQRKNPGETAKLKRQYDRLVDDGQMGLLFKVLGICGRRWPFGVGFEQ
ncbi:class I SAM-dependent methyltransferase [Erythrobacter sp.]|jgi:SAM-dependent MidA family methyltransferase|uniref:class I SAM-dependent methyltransferase n=1 Tax=Erythrobacter sp. TaxID=1042 RepID=UPI002E9EDB88|nr:SAM-dependent methyltransferase [Erythrobacter sp.]